MATTLEVTFATRREAEMAIERLVQEHGVERSDIFVAAEGQANTAGVELAGSDTEAASPSPPDRGDSALNGAIVVSVDLNDEGRAADVRAAFAEFGGEPAKG
jgi:hypothetical protein